MRQISPGATCSCEHASWKRLVGRHDEVEGREDASPVDRCCHEGSTIVLLVTSANPVVFVGIKGAQREPKRYESSLEISAPAACRNIREHPIGPNTSLKLDLRCNMTLRNLICKYKAGKSPRPGQLGVGTF